MHREKQIAFWKCRIPIWMLCKNIGPPLWSPHIISGCTVSWELSLLADKKISSPGTKKLHCPWMWTHICLVPKAVVLLTPACATSPAAPMPSLLFWKRCAIGDLWSGSGENQEGTLWQKRFLIKSSCLSLTLTQCEGTEREGTYLIVSLTLKVPSRWNNSSYNSSHHMCQWTCSLELR